MKQSEAPGSTTRGTQHTIAAGDELTIPPAVDSGVSDGFYAIHDPTDPDVVTFWRRTGDTLTPWPDKARYGPALYRKQLPPGIRGQERREWILRWQREVRDPWWDAIRKAVGADARAMFAMITVRCFVCGRSLTDPESQLLGIGPDCRRKGGAA